MYQTILRYKEIEFSNEIPEESIVCADADLLSCVIRNLMSNAIKYTAPHGYIRIEQIASENYVTVIVTDTGAGIPESRIDVLFSDSIVPTAGLMQEKGSGIGLKLCKEFVELNGGTIRAHSIPGACTQFIFTIPAPPSVTARSTLAEQNLHPSQISRVFEQNTHPV
jgi:signal transduction histidine kinase